MPNPLGLSRNAWVNAKSYAATSFPGNPVEGDRILRTDIGMGVWFTYIGTLWQPDVWANFVTLNNGAATNAGNTAVSYNFPSGAGWTAIPRVVVSLATAGTGTINNKMIARATNGSTTGFFVTINSGDASNGSWSGLVAHYIASPAGTP